MKVTVTFGDTAVVVPCKDGWTVRDVTDQATRRYRKILEKAQHLEYVVRIHHVEYDEGGILDMDDPITDLLEDKDRLVAVFEEEPRGRGLQSRRQRRLQWHASPAPFLEPLQYNSHSCRSSQSERRSRSTKPCSKATLLFW
ncbi:par-3 family cell polarity regulator beta a [Gadus macrocephalus]|uniref:par-3 family cell polarity regulator beta a n=1 Tax=Gadus macrocephalus TaxID=80720 RepID=UPI0028CB8E35|nr:par-3 family cell polarity regulator beta a [Gadus macrocephalus]